MRSSCNNKFAINVPFRDCNLLSHFLVSLTFDLFTAPIQPFFVFKRRCCRVSWMRNGLTALNFIASGFVPSSFALPVAHAEGCTRISFAGCSFRWSYTVISFTHVRTHAYTHPMGITFERERLHRMEALRYWGCVIIGAIGREDPAWKCSWRKWWRGRGIARPFDGAMRSN